MAWARPSQAIDIRRASPGRAAVAAHEGHAVAGRELGGVVAQRADAQLRAREVLQDRHRAPGAARRLAHALRGLGVQLGGAVGEVQPRDVHARLDHAHEDLGIARGGPIVATIFVRRSMRAGQYGMVARVPAPRSTRERPAVNARQPPQPGEHGQHAAVVVLGGRQAELHEDVRDVLLDRALGDHQLLGDGRVRAALGHQPEHVALARGELVERAVVALAQQLGDRLGVQRGAALGHAPHGVDEVAHLGDAVLEQVADAAAPVGEQLGGVGALDVLREHQDRQPLDPRGGPRARRARPRR